MNCIKCGANAYQLQETFLSSDFINGFGRRELNYTANIKENIHWQSDFMFHCDACGATFSFTEAVAAHKNKAEPQTKLTNIIQTGEQK
jgi:hypothetical protein